MNRKISQYTLFAFQLLLLVSCGPKIAINSKFKDGTLQNKKIVFNVRENESIKYYVSSLNKHFPEVAKEFGVDLILTEKISDKNKSSIKMLMEFRVEGVETRTVNNLEMAFCTGYFEVVVKDLASDSNIWKGDIDYECSDLGNDYDSKMLAKKTFSKLQEDGFLSSNKN